MGLIEVDCLTHLNLLGLTCLPYKRVINNLKKDVLLYSLFVLLLVGIANLSSVLIEFKMSVDMFYTYKYNSCLVLNIEIEN